MDAIQLIAEQFVKEKLENELLLIGICWVGQKLQCGYKVHTDITEKLGSLIWPKGTDDSDYLPYYELTSLGEPICLNEYATRIAGNEATHVIQFDDQ